MALLDEVKVNGNVFSWTSTIFKLDEESLEGQVTALDFEQKRERKLVKGGRRSGKPIGKTGGQYSAEPVTVTAIRACALAIKSYLAKKGSGSSYGNVEFTLALQLVEENNDVVTVTFERCHIVGSKDGHKEGSDELTTDLTIQPESIKESVNGVDLVLYDDTDEV